MSSFGVTLERVIIRPHPNAERLELARIGLYDAVVEKGKLQTGDVIFYIPEQAILPDALIKTLGLEGKLSGGKKNRVKAISLRGALSQGLTAPLSVLNLFPEDSHYSEAVDALRSLDADFLPTYDFAPLLGITKWQPVVPAHMGGDVAPASDLLPWIDIENLKRYPHIFETTDKITVTEKVHGTCLLSTFMFTHTVIDGVVEYTVDSVLVSSKGVAEKNLSLREEANNLYWRAVRENNVEALALELAETLSELENPVTKIGVYGEVYGQGIQDLGYGVIQGKSQPGFAVFDASVQRESGAMEWVTPATLSNAMTPINHVPVLWEGEFTDIEHIAEIASGKEQLSGTEANMREGVVIRSTNNLPWVDRFGNTHRKIAKFVTEEYLTRRNGTEYQ